MPELRKRKATESVAPPPVKKANSAKPSTSKKSVLDGNKSASKLSVGDSIDLRTFGGEVETHDGKKVRLRSLAEESKNGIVLFTYPKASTPGCTTQACLFRDDYASLTSTGFAIYGLSTDSPKSNTAFRVKQKLPYPLLCDPKEVLISAIGLKKSPSGTIRGVFVIDKQGKVKAATPGGPAATVDTVRQLVEKPQITNPINGAAVQDVPDQEARLEHTASIGEMMKSKGETKDGPAKTKVAAPVADAA